MAVDQRELIDILSFDGSNGDVVLTISDHLDWSESTKHQEILQSKFNGYLAFVQGGQLFNQYPDANGRRVVFKVVFKYRPDREGTQFLERARQVLESAGFQLRHELFVESYNN